MKNIIRELLIIIITLLLYITYISVLFLVGSLIVYLFNVDPILLFIGMLTGWLYRMFSNDYNVIIRKMVDNMIKDKTKYD